MRAHGPSTREDQILESSWRAEAGFVSQGMVCDCLTCDGVVRGIQRRVLVGDVAADRSIKTPTKPLWLQPVLVNRVENLREIGL
jgi:hypothetical protein